MKSNNGFPQATISLRNSIRNTFKICQLMICLRNPRAGFVFFPAYLQLPNKDRTDNAWMITMKIWLNANIPEHTHTHTFKKSSSKQQFKSTFPLFTHTRIGSAPHVNGYPLQTSPPYQRNLNSKILLLSVHNVKISMKNKWKRSWEHVGIHIQCFWGRL